MSTTSGLGCLPCRLCAGTLPAPVSPLQRTEASDAPVSCSCSFCAQVVGYHRGFWFHTVGQRKGIPLHGGPWCAPHVPRRRRALLLQALDRTDAPRCPPRAGSRQWSAPVPHRLLCHPMLGVCPCRYVTRKDPDSNAVYVSRQYHERAGEGVRSTFSVGPLAWCSSARPDPARPLHCKARACTRLGCGQWQVQPGWPGRCSCACAPRSCS